LTHKAARIPTTVASQLLPYNDPDSLKVILKNLATATSDFEMLLKPNSCLNI